MRQGFGGIVLSTAFRLLVPFSIIYGVYILCFGEYSPGGGFQAGALLAVGVLLSRMILGEDAKFNVSGKTSVVMAGVGTFLYTLVGSIPWTFVFVYVGYALRSLKVTSVSILSIARRVRASV